MKQFRIWAAVCAAFAFGVAFTACDDSPTNLPDSGSTVTAPEAAPEAAAETSTGETTTDALFAIVDPIFVPANPDCDDLGYDNGFKVDQGCPDAGGTFQDGDPGTVNTVGGPFPGQVTITCGTTQGFIDWTSTYPMQAVIMKGGPDSHVYVYDPPILGDTDLTTPPQNGTFFGVSHVEFCYEFALVVEKDATPDEFNGQDDWEITKDLVIEGTAQDGPESHVGFPGDAFDTAYRVSVDWMGFLPGTEVWTVVGSITINNPAPFAATVSSIVDVISGSAVGPPVNATVQCLDAADDPLAFPFDIPAGGTQVCTYFAELGEGDYDLNTATVNTTGPVNGGEATATFDLDNANAVITTIEVVDCFDDAFPGSTEPGGFDACDPLGTADDDKTFDDYDRDFVCPTDEGLYENGVYTETFPNRAHIVDPNEFDDESVDITCYLPAKAEANKTTIEGAEDIGQFPFVFNLKNPSGVIVESENVGTGGGTASFDWEIKTEGTWTIEEVLPAGWFSTTPTSCTFEVAFPAAAGQTFKCAFDPFNNVEKSRVTVYKLTQGQPTTSLVWTFKLFEGPDGFDGTLLATDQTPPALLDFGNIDLQANLTYTLCELEVPAGYSSRFEWMVNSTTVIPYNPNADDLPPEDLGNRCVDFGDNTPWPLVPGEILAFQVDNSQPGGAPRTPGYWKNWNRCTGGGQQYTADANGGPDEGFWLVDDIIEPDGVYIGDYLIDNCYDAVDLLDKRDTRGKKKASDPFINLATSLLAARLNFAAGACTTPDVNQWALDAQTLLDEVGFEGDALGKRADGADQARMLQEYLDDYNNGEYCGDGFD